VGTGFSLSHSLPVVTPPVYAALLPVYAALLPVYTALLAVYAALLAVYAVTRRSTQ
jgi:hypothetical protein